MHGPSALKARLTHIACRAERGLSTLGMVGMALAALIVWSTALAAPSAAVMHAHIRLLPGNLPLAGYFDLVNRGEQTLILTGASSPAFRTVRMHHSIEENGISAMAPVRHLEIKPGATLRFSPDGYHLMLMRRAKPLRVGDQVPVTLRFTGDGSLRVMFEVMGAETE